MQKVVEKFGKKLFLHYICKKSNFDAKSCGKICKRANVHRIFAAFLGIMMINEGTKYCRIEKTCVPLQPISGNRKLTILLT